jgi:hypothetical protein
MKNRIALDRKKLLGFRLESGKSAGCRIGGKVGNVKGSSPAKPTGQ